MIVYKKYGAEKIPDKENANPVFCPVEK